MPLSATRVARSGAGPRTIASWALALASAWCAIAGAASPLSAQARVVESLVAVVGARSPGDGADVVLLSDVDLGVALALARAGARDALPTSALRQAVLEQLIGELLIQREALRLGAAEPTAPELAEQRLAFERSLGGEGALRAIARRVSAGPSELDALVRRRAIVEHFLGANLEGASEVTEAELTSAYTDAAHPFADRPLPEIREALRAWLRARLIDTYVARWLTTLRGRTEVHVLRPFTSARAAEADSASEEIGKIGEIGEASDVEPR